MTTDMTTVGPGKARRARTVGWGLLLTVAVLLLANGVGWWFMGGSLSMFEQDTGASLPAFRQAYPGVAAWIASEARVSSIWYAGFGLLASLVALHGLRRGSAAAWSAFWVVTVTVAALTVAVFANGNVGFGAFLAGTALVALVGQGLARP